MTATQKNVSEGSVEPEVKNMVRIQDVKNTNKTTIIVHDVQADNKPIMERTIKKALKSSFNAYENGIIPGNGMIYLLIAQRIRNGANKTKGKEAIAMQSMAEVFESMYKTLAENNGKQGLDAYVAARKDITTGNDEHPFYSEPQGAFKDQLQRALETTTSILRIDEVVSAKPLMEASAGSSGVTIYTSDGCPWCARTKEYLRSKGVSFTEKNVSRDPYAAQEMMSASGQSGTPVTVIRGQSVVGFDEARLESLL
jgi:glutaredoxin 3